MTPNPTPDRARDRRTGGNRGAAGSSGSGDARDGAGGRGRASKSPNDAPLSPARGQRQRGGTAAAPDRGSSRRDERGGDSRGKPGGDRGGDSRNNRDGDRGGDSRNNRDSDRGTDRGRPRARDEATRAADQARYNGPPLDEAITGHELDHTITQHFRGLPEKLANRIARHLVAAALLADTDPETAYQHTLAARARAARIAIVREACGEAAYSAGHYSEALAELRAAKRINGSPDYLHIIADCERALGHPERALTLIQNSFSNSVHRVPPDQQAELTIVEAGARRDLGQLDAALRTLENAPLHTQTRAPWVTRLRYTYADTLDAAGRSQEAVEWFHRTAATDSDQVTDAEQRASQLERGGTPAEDA